MIRKAVTITFISLVLMIAGCVKETYNMNTLSKQAHISPTWAISAVKGDVQFSDMVKASDTVVFDQNKLVTLVFRKDSVVDLKLSDFAKGTVVKTATIDPGTFDLNIEDIFSHITGDFLMESPVIKFNYINSFTDSVKVTLIASGHRGSGSVNLNLKPFGLVKPNLPAQQEVNTTYVIDKNNSNLPQLVSLPPSYLSYSGSAKLTVQTKSGTEPVDLQSPGRLTGSLEVDIPLDLKVNNLQYADTVDNFIKTGKGSDNTLDPANFQLLQVLLSATNGFPLGVSVKMSLYDSATHTLKSTVDASSLLKPAPVDASGKATGTTESSTVIEFSRTFFSEVDKADKIIFWFTLNSTSNSEVKIYSDYRINFKAAVVVKPDVTFTVDNPF